MILNIEIDLIGLFVLFLINKNRRKPQSCSADQRIFNWILLTTSLTMIFDAAMWLIDGQSFPGARALNWLSSTLYYLVQPFVCFYWLEYCDYRIYGDESGLRRRRIIYSAGLLLGLILIAANGWTGGIFYIDDSNHYHRGNLFLVYLLLSFCYLIYAGLICLRKARHCRPSEQADYRQLAFFLLPPLLGSVLQTYFYGLSLIWIFTVLSLLMIFLHEQNRRISTDDLTGLCNRRWLDSYLETSTSDPNPGCRLFAIMVDVDHFKFINDTYGHSAGDMALKHVAAILKRACVDRGCFLARIGGDEFVIACRTRNAAEPEEIISRIRTEEAAFNHTGQEVYSLSMSMGYAEYHNMGAGSVAKLLSDADLRMYEEKREKAARRIRA